MRLIDADEIKKREHDVVLENGAKHRCFDTTRLYEIPTIDAVPVIRCKDCKEYAEWGDSMICMRLDSYHGDTKPNDFCSRAERKE